jgi:thiol-disulfide isomerase/thioredoxin
VSGPGWPKGAAILAGLALAWMLGCGAPEGDSPADAGRGPAPDFALPNLAGGELSLADLAGRPVVLDFWATWCAPCIRQVPVLNAIHERYGDQVSVVGVSVDVDAEEVVPPFVEEHEIQYRVLLGDEGLAQRYGALGFPTLFVLGPEGTILAVHSGVITEQALEEALAAWIR